MLTLNDGRSELWQWDTGRTLSVDADCTQVHFSNKVFGRSIDVDVVDGVAIIPDILLQTDKELNVWAFVGTAENGYTKIGKTFKINRRNKPADYVFTQTDQTTLSELVERLDKIEESQDPNAIKNAVDEYLANNPIRVDEKDPTVPGWAKQPTKPKYTANEVGAVATVNGTAPDENGNVEIEIPEDSEPDMTGYATERYVQENYQPKGDYLTKVPDDYAKTDDIPKVPSDIGAQPAGNYALVSQIPSVPVQSVNGKTGAVSLSAADVGARPVNWMPSAEDVGALPATYTPPNQTAEQVGADPKGTAASAVSQHNTADDSHGDIRLELKAINDCLTAFFDSDNQTLDELSEIVAYITSNKSLIDSITTSKVSVADIINNLTTNVSNKPLSAAQGVVLKGLIDTLSGNLANYQPKGNYLTSFTETDPTVPSWAKAASKPSYSKSEVGLGNVDNVKQYSASNPPPYPVTSVNGKTGAVTVSVPTKVSQLQNDTGFLTEISKEEIVQQVIIALGTPVFGRVEEGNKIITTGKLAAGIYEYWFEDENGKQVLVGTLNNVPAPTYTNVLPLAKGEDGNPYNGTGYAVGKRINSSWNETTVSVTTATNPVFLTGRIPIPAGATVRFKNCYIDTNGVNGAVNDAADKAYYGHNLAGLYGCMLYYNATSGTGNKAGTNYTWDKFASYSNLASAPTVDSNGYVTEFTFNTTETLYARFVLGGDPTTAVITINEPITD